MIEVEKVVKYGDISYYIKGTKILHREDGPAVILPGAAKIWYCNGKLHREDGPAIVHSTGVVSWVLDNEFFSTKEEWFEALTEEQRLKALYTEYFIRD